MTKIVYVLQKSNDNLAVTRSGPRVANLKLETLEQCRKNSRNHVSINTGVVVLFKSVVILKVQNKINTKADKLSGEIARTFICSVPFGTLCTHFQGFLPNMCLFSAECNQLSHAPSRLVSSHCNFGMR